MGSQRAPKGLAEAGKRLWRSHSDGLTFRPDELAALESACRTADLIAELDEVIAASPTMIPGSMKQMVVHPAIQEARLQRQLLASLLSRLDLPEADGLGGSEWDGLSATQRARKAALARHHRGAA